MMACIWCVPSICAGQSALKNRLQLVERYDGKVVRHLAKLVEVGTEVTGQGWPSVPSPLLSVASCTRIPGMEFRDHPYGRQAFRLYCPGDLLRHVTDHVIERLRLEHGQDGRTFDAQPDPATGVCCRLPGNFDAVVITLE